MPELRKQDFTFSNIVSRLTADFHLSIICILGFFVLVTLTPFVVFRAIQGQWIIVALDLGMIFLTAGLVTYGWISHKSQTAAMVMATSISGGFVLTAFTNSAVAPYWLYCMVLFSFSLVPPRKAALLSLLGFCAIIVQPQIFPEGVYKVTFIVTLAATALFSYIFATRNEYHRNALIEIARTDELTRIGNRRAFNEEFAVALANTQRTKESTALALLDIDHFKQINDNFGHDIGDDVLVKITCLIKKNLRPKDRVFRVGGEEFCMLLETTDKLDAQSSMTRLKDIIGQSSLIEGKQVTSSIGLTQITDNDTLGSCLKRSDEALYKAKNNGRNLVVFIE